jgi:Malectin domain
MIPFSPLSLLTIIPYLVTPSSVAVLIPSAVHSKYYKGVGKRIFDVAVEGKLVSENLDIFGVTTGKHMAYVTSNLATVTDGFVSIEFIAGIAEPAIYGIEVIPYKQSVNPIPVPTPILITPSAPSVSPPTAVFTEILINCGGILWCCGDSFKCDLIYQFAKLCFHFGALQETHI